MMMMMTLFNHANIVTSTMKRIKNKHADIYKYSKSISIYKIHE
jgi:hypothetical protein